jgi:hypothetical protein
VPSVLSPRFSAAEHLAHVRALGILRGAPSARRSASPTARPSSSPTALVGCRRRARGDSSTALVHARGQNHSLAAHGGSLSLWAEQAREANVKVGPDTWVRGCERRLCPSPLATPLEACPGAPLLLRRRLPQRALEHAIGFLVGCVRIGRSLRGRLSCAARTALRRTRRVECLLRERLRLLGILSRCREGRTVLVTESRTGGESNRRNESYQSTSNKMHVHLLSRLAPAGVASVFESKANCRGARHIDLHQASRRWSPPRRNDNTRRS